MARRKPAAPKKTMKVEAKFQCPFCYHQGSVECFFDEKIAVVEAVCRVCGERYATKFHRLTEPIDVYDEWLDECEKANEEFVNES